MARNFLESISGGGFPISIQVDPPANMSSALKYIEQIQKMKCVGVGLVDINTKKDLALDPIMLGSIFRKNGIAFLPHLAPRDEPSANIAKRIMTSYIYDDLREVLVLSGDPPDRVRRANNTNIWQSDEDSICAIRVISRLLRDSKYCPDLKIAAAFNHNAVDMACELGRLAIKDDLGVDFYMSQIVFGELQLYDLINKVRSVTDKPLIIGIWPVMHGATLGAIRRGDVSGVVMPDDMAKEIEALKSDDDIRKWGIDSSLDFIEKIKAIKDIQGLYLVAPRRKPELILDVWDSLSR